MTGVEPAKCAILRRIVLDTDAEIVLSSTWRKFPSVLPYLWDQLGIEIKERWIGSTPCHDRLHDSGLYTAEGRGREIQAWLDQHPEVTNFVIIDDDTDMGALMPHLVKTDNNIGITEKNASEVINRLKPVPA